MENPKFLNLLHRKKIIAAAVVAFFLMAFGCSFYGGIKGTVLDNATGKPIEGAIVVAQWTKQRGIPGMQYHNLHKITETLTNKEGKFSLSGTIGVMLEPPEMIVCKEGYIPWRNDIFYQSKGGIDRNEENEWKNHQTYRLDKFTGTGKDIIWLSDFSSYGFMGQDMDRTPNFNQYITVLRDAGFSEMKKTSNK